MLRNAVNGMFKWKIGNIFFGRGGRRAWPMIPLRARTGGTGPALAFHTIGDESYCNGVQPPLSEIPGSATARPVWPTFKER